MLKQLVHVALAIFAVIEARAETSRKIGYDDALANIVTVFEAKPGEQDLRQWTAPAGGSVRLVGSLQKLSRSAEAEIDVRVDGRSIWQMKLDATDYIRRGFDVVAYELEPQSEVEFRVIAGTGLVRVSVDFQIVPEPFVSRWQSDLPSGYPVWSEDQKEVLRKKGQAVLQTIRDASSANRPRIVIPPGDYLFHANWSQASTLEALTDLEIVAKGVTFWFEPPMIHGLLFENCRNVTVSGLTIDFTAPAWSQARVTKIDRKKKIIQAKIMKGYGPCNASGQTETLGERKIIFYKSDGVFMNHRHTHGDWKLSADGTRISYSNVRVSGIPDQLEVSDYVVSPIQTGAALRSLNCARMQFQDINIWSSPGQAVNETGGTGGNVYKRVRCTRRPHTNRLQAFGADIFHLANTDHGPTLDRCEMAYGADDNVNIHGSFGRVVKRQNERRYYLDGAYAAGDRIEFRDFNSVDLLGFATVDSATKTPDGPSLAINDKYKAKGETLVELDKPLELPPLSLVVFDGKRSAAGFVIRNCWLHDNFQRTLINGSPDGLIENNTLQNVGMGVYVQFETWGPWMEGPFARDLIIRNNRFLDSPPDGASITISMHPPGSGSNHRRFTAKPVTNLTVDGNFFGQTSGTPIVIHNVADLKIIQNSIDRPPGIPISKGLANSSTVNWLYLQDCENVEVTDNQTPGTP
ncbi:MAG: hypothetical protein H7A55_04145 [Verrucomicrobiaceae bacterium]|nr:hypothetical protein [Verrucomicrobiaceae bacterium]